MFHDSVSAVPRLRRWRTSTFWVLLVGYVGYYLCRANMSAAFPLLSQRFGYSNSQLGLIAFYSEIAYALGKFVTGPWSDRLDGRRVFLIGMAGAVFFNVLFAQMGGLTAFIVVWCACRFFLSMGWGGIVKTIGAWYPPERNGTIMGLISLNFQFGGVVGTVFAGYLVARGASWQAIFLWPAAIVSLFWVGSYFGAKESPEKVDPTFRWPARPDSLVHFEAALPIRQTIGRLASNAFFRHVLAFSFLTTFLRSIFFFWTPKLLVDIGLGNANAIFKSALFPLLGCLGTVFLGWYTDRFARDGDRTRMMSVMLAGLVLSLIAVATLIDAPGAGPSSHAGAIVALIGMAGFFLLGPYSMSAGCLTLDIAGTKGAGSTAGFVDGIGYVGGALATWATGFMADAWGWKNVFGMLSVFATLALISSILMGRAYRLSRSALRGREAAAMSAEAASLELPL
jgi:MFS transporter, OPA family, glycerol-3-phosphate transporter